MFSFLSSSTSASLRVMVPSLGTSPARGWRCPTGAWGMPRCGSLDCDIGDETLGDETLGDETWGAAGCELEDCALASHVDAIDATTATKITIARMMSLLMCGTIDGTLRCPSARERSERNNACSTQMFQWQPAIIANPRQRIYVEFARGCG
jgi:hypothetical protein